MLNIIDIHIVPEENHHIRIQEYAATVFDLLPTRSAVKKALKRNELYIDGEIATSDMWIKTGQEIVYAKTPKTTPKVFPLELNVPFEDDFLALVVKPAGYPTNGNFYKTIEHALPHNLTKSTQKDALSFPLPVHRLDNPTSGLLLIAKTYDALRKLHLQFEHNAIKKTYHAIVAGNYIHKKIIEEPVDNKSAITEVEEVTQAPSLQNSFLTLLKLSPKTGRTHQLRIHLSNQGTPIVGDRIYGHQNIMMHKGLFLHASQLSFQHPITQEKMIVNCDLPNKFHSYLNREKNRYLKYQ